jgi:hypothetical protein
LKTTDFSASYLAKFSKTGELIIFKTYGEEFLTETWDIKNDKEGNLYLTGFHCGTIKIDGITFPSGPKMSCAMFVAKFNDKAELIWFKHFFSSGNSCGHSINFDNENSCYLTGSFYQDIKLKKKIKSKDKGGSVIIKLNAKGDILAYKAYIGLGDINFWNTFLSEVSNCLYTTGSFTKCITLGKVYEVCSENDKDILILKTDKNLKD